MGTLTALFNQDNCEGDVLDEIVQDLVYDFFVDLTCRFYLVSFSDGLGAKISHKAIRY